MTNNTTFHFPKDFHWGAAYPLYTHRAKIKNNNWEAWIQPEEEADIPKTDWEIDFEKANTIHLNTILINLDWSAVQPQKDIWHESILEKYREMLMNLTEKNITPIVNLFHFVEPLWFYEAGGWTNPSSVPAFEKYAEKICSTLKEYCCHWISFLEPNKYIFNACRSDRYPPGNKSIADYFKAKQHIAKAHEIAYGNIHHQQGNALVSFGKSFEALNAKGSPISEWVNSNLFNKAFTQSIYQKNLFDIFFLTLHSYSKPELHSILKWATHFEKPIFILGSINSSTNKSLFMEQLHQLWHSANLNPYLEGFIYTPLIDSSDWEQITQVRTGLITAGNSTASQPNLAIREIFYEVCKNNAISYQMVEKQAPLSLNNLFP